MKKTVLVLFFLILISCNKSSENKSEVIKPELQPELKVKDAPLTKDFKNYWFDGNAELTSFKLEQARYGEIREGTAVVVFVAEDFSKSRKVKLDYPNKNKKDKVKVLKFNLNKKFVTGIYDYALMQSVFTPIHQISNPNTLRVSTSNIEWCGQFLTRLELNDEKFKINYNSYFDGEEDLELFLDKSILEDEIWNQIRINPEKLPIGDFKIIPGILTQELIHHPLKVENAIGTISYKNGISTYILDYKSISRQLKINFESKFPYKIVSWEETFKTVEGWGMESKIMTTKATRISDTKLNYWERKYLKDETLRNTLLKLKD